MPGFLNDLVDFDFIKPSEGKNWPSLKTSVDVLRSLPTIFVWSAGLAALSKNGDILSTAALFAIGPVLALLLFASILQTAMLFLLTVGGIPSMIPGVPITFVSVRSRFPRAFKYVSFVITLPLAYVFIVVTLWAASHIPVAG